MKFLYERKRAESAGNVQPGVRPVRAVAPVRAAAVPVHDPEVEVIGEVISLVRADAAPVRAVAAPVRAAVAPVRAAVAPVRAVVAPVRATAVPVRATAVPVRRREEEVNRAISLCRDMLARVSTMRVDSRIKTTALREKCVEVGVSPMELSGSVYSNKEVKAMEEMLVSNGVGMASVKASYQTVKTREIENERARITARMEALERRRV